MYGIEQNVLGPADILLRALAESSQPSSPSRRTPNMNRANPRIRNFATRLIGHETSGDKSPDLTTPAAFRICEKLRPHLATLMGNGGFRALVTRALALAKAEVPELRTVRVNADGTLEESSEPGVHPDNLAEGRAILLAQLLGLLTAFIGAHLTLGLVRSVWPELRLSGTEFDSGDDDEKTN